MDRNLTKCAIFGLCLVSLVWSGRCLAAGSRQDLALRISRSLTRELPPEIGSLAILHLGSAIDEGLDVDPLRRDLELELVSEPRFEFANQLRLSSALREAGLCGSLDCFLDPEALRRFGSETGIDAFLIGDIVDSSARLSNLGGRDCFTTVHMRAVSTQAFTTVWEAEITGIDSLSISSVLGALPDSRAVSGEAAFAAALVDFLNGSAKLGASGASTLALLEIETADGMDIDADALYARIAGAIAADGPFAVLDRSYLETCLRALGLPIGALAETGGGRELCSRFGIEALVSCQVVSAGEDHIECIVRVSGPGAVTDMAAQRVIGRARDGSSSLPQLLSGAGPTSIETQPAGAEITLDGSPLGHTPYVHWLPNGDHRLGFALPGYERNSLTLRSDFGGAQTLLIELTPKTRGKALLRSLILPGLGQRYRERRTRSWLFSIAAVGAAGFAMMNQSAYDDAVADYDAARAEYRAAYSQVDMDAAFAVMEESFASAGRTRDRRDFAMLTLGGVWLANLVDAALGSPVANAGVRVGAVTTPGGRTALAATIGMQPR